MKDSLKLLESIMQIQDIETRKFAFDNWLDLNIKTIEVSQRIDRFTELELISEQDLENNLIYSIANHMVRQLCPEIRRNFIREGGEHLTTYKARITLIK